MGADSPIHAHINIRSPRYFIARTRTFCGHCRTLVPVYALGVPPGHETLELDDEAPDEAQAADTWAPAGYSAFLFHVEFIPTAIQSRLRRQAPSLRCVAVDAAMDSRWVNHCEDCGASFEDQELFCEPGAFLPTHEASAGTIHLLSVVEPFEAAAAGYAPEPWFFHAMSRE